ncbi:MAG: hypothetical protein Q8904_13920 [Bacteroidota bacterium]|nr:hypothetical protein [Bacteroidota bacterium]
MSYFSILKATSSDFGVFISHIAIGNTRPGYAAGTSLRGTRTSLWVSYVIAGLTRNLRNP